MELHKVLDIKEKYNSSLDQDYKSYFDEAKRFALTYYKEDVERIGNTNFSEVSAEMFLREMCWVICTSGFNAKIVSKFFGRLYAIFKPFFDDCINDKTDDIKEVERQALLVFNNKMKISSIIANARWIGIGIHEVGWEYYRDTYLNTTGKLQVLNMIGPKISLHLGRNIGIDSVKDDIHLTRLADKFGFTTAEELCTKLSEEHNMKKGIIDLCLWYYSSTFGSK